MRSLVKTFPQLKCIQQQLAYFQIGVFYLRTSKPFRSDDFFTGRLGRLSGSYSYILDKVISGRIKTTCPIGDRSGQGNFSNSSASISDGRWIGPNLFLHLSDKCLFDIFTGLSVSARDLPTSLILSEEYTISQEDNPAYTQTKLIWRKCVSRIKRSSLTGFPLPGTEWLHSEERSKYR